MRNGRIAARALTLALLGCLISAPAAALIPPSEPTPAIPPPHCDADARFSGTPCAGRKARPATLEEFLAPPRKAEWDAQLAMGWFGSDGSTAASDLIGGVRIGLTSRAPADLDLPANRHDWYYEVGRSHGLGWRFRRAADQSYRDMCLERLQHLDGARGLAARVNVHGRYLALRIVGIGAWLAKPGA